jgi:hypothetical protein
MTTWYGWGRKGPGHRWQQLVGPCGTLQECARALAEAGRNLGTPAKNQLITGGREPPAAPAPPARPADRVALAAAEVELLKARLANHRKESG